MIKSGTLTIHSTQHMQYILAIDMMFKMAEMIFRGNPRS